MAEIKRLSQELIGKIAAGEVVERPASVVKELAENAIDAGATHITVELRGGGVEYIRISDNGRGIPAEQIRMAFERHATSKLQTQEQLFDIHTLGFRGEALASVAAVAKVTCTTKTAEAAFGVRCTVEGGEFTDIRQAASPVGTAFVVEDLFYNTPVRRKFLKKPAMEASLVSDYMLRLILSRPEISFRFVSQGKTVYHSMGDGKLASALFCLYGKDAFQRMIPVKGHLNGALLEGYVGVGELCRGNRQQQSFFVNGRYFRSGPLSRALENGCQGRVMVGKFPMCALFLQLPYANVDVNVHPNKLEVRFSDENGVADAVRALVSDTLHGETLGESLRGGQKAPPEGEAAPRAAQEGFSVMELNPGPEAGEGGTGAGREAPVAMASHADMVTPTGREVPHDMTTPVDRTIPTGTATQASSQGASASTVSSNGYAPPAPGDGPSAPSVLSTPAMPRPVSIPAFSYQPAVLRETVAPIAGIRPTQTAPENKAPLVVQGSAAAQSQRPNPPALPTEAAPAKQQAEAEKAEKPEQTQLLPPEAQAVPPRLVGVVFDTYWIFQAGEKLLLVDQHAAHERMLYDQMMKRAESGQLSQQLLSPQLVRLTPRDMALAGEMREALADAGFDTEPFDECNLAVRAIPTLFGRNESPRELLLEALDEGQAGRGQVTGERMRRQVAQMACKRAIKGGDRLSEPEMKGFLAEMLQSGVMPTCPHGRPIVTELTRYELEKRFKRVQ